MRRRILTIALAVVLAAAGTVAVLAYVHQANARAVQGMKAVSVVVAKSTIPSGTSAGQAQREGLLGSQEEPASSVPPDAVTSITSDIAKLVTSAVVSAGQLLLRPMLVTAAQVTGGVAIPKGMIAVTMQLCLPEDVAGYVTAGAQVAVFDTYTSVTQGSVQRTCNVAHPALLPGDVHTAMVLPRVEVLSIGPAASAAGDGGVLSSDSASSALQGAVLVTMAVSQADAERLIEVEEAGLPYLGLLTATSQTRFDAAPAPLFQP